MLGFGFAGWTTEPGAELDSVGKSVLGGILLEEFNGVGSITGLGRR